MRASAIGRRRAAVSTDGRPARSRLAAHYHQSRAQEPEANGPDLFKCSGNCDARWTLLGFARGVDGAHRDAWASGMRCDVGEGRVVYLLKAEQTTRPSRSAHSRRLRSSASALLMSRTSSARAGCNGCGPTTELAARPADPDDRSMNSAATPTPPLAPDPIRNREAPSCG